MTKKMTIALFVFLTASTVFAQRKMIVGDIVQKDELLIVNGNISCSATVLDDVAKPDPKKIIYAEYDFAMQRDNHFQISGTANGNSFNIHGNTLLGYVRISWSEEADVKPGELAPTRFSSSGHLQKDQTSTVELTVFRNGKATQVGCSKIVR